SSGRLFFSGAAPAPTPMAAPAGLPDVRFDKGRCDGMTDVERRPLTVRMARWSATHPWRAMALWVVFVALSITMGTIAGTKKAHNAGYVGETKRTEQMVEAGNFPQEPAVERVLVSSPSGPLNRGAAKAGANDVATRMAALTGVSKVTGPVFSHDGSTMLV